MSPKPQNGASVGVGVEAKFAAALRDGTPIEGIHNGRGRPAADRFSVYRNNVIVSLRDALKSTFVATERLMGEDYFSAAVAYAEQEKPACPRLYRYGKRFAELLAALPGLADYPFVPEVARLEYSFVQSTHAADRPPLSPDALGTVGEDALGGVRFLAHPAAAVLMLPEGGLEAWQANTGAPRRPAPAALLTRAQLTVLVTPLDAPAADFTAALLNGTPLGEAAARDSLALDTALGTLLSVGAFCALLPGQD